MQFKQPEVLYALFLLLIPILIHLFQLRRFQKVDFTNVAFLKKVTIQTRKSSRLKKWLTLLLRLLALTAIILAFAQPFTATETALDENRQTVLYVDNSFSMQAKGANGPLLSRALQQLFDHSGGEDQLSWFTNDSEASSVSLQDFKSDILNVQYSNKQLNPDEVLFKASEMLSDAGSTGKRLIYISDLQQVSALPEVPEDISVEIVQMSPVAVNNIAIDTAYLSSDRTTQATLNVRVSSQGEVAENIPVSLFQNNTLTAKVAADLSERGTAEINFDINAGSEFVGKLEINDANLLYDNSLYFSINDPDKIKVLSINEADSAFLTRLFSDENFEYTQQSSNSLNYSDIVDQNLLILNELSSIPASLDAALQGFVNDGGTLVIIPGQGLELSSYNRMLNGFDIGNIGDFVSREKFISKISFEHPLFKGVFERQVTNFQFPKVNGYYSISSRSTSALEFQDGKPFLLQNGNVYLYSAPINTENSNFQSSPLIVPTYYNTALRSLKLPQIYQEIAVLNEFSVPVKLGQDEILTIKDSISELIPIQQTKANKVDLQTSDEPKNSGNYGIFKGQEEINRISFNYQRTESKLSYHDAGEWQGVRTYDSIESLFDTLGEENRINSYWKWFVIFAVLFLMIEMLVLKFYKN